jgi:hypothetical protein
VSVVDIDACARIEERGLAQALARKRARVAFPDDFASLVDPLVKRVVAKHDRYSEEGKALRTLKQIRVAASPCWSADDVSLMFLFIRDEEEPDFNGCSWADRLESWMGLLVPEGRFSELDGMVVTLDDLTASDYVDSDPLDLDQLSAPDGSDG